MAKSKQGGFSPGGRHVISSVPAADNGEYWRRKGFKLRAAGERKKSADAFKRYLAAPLFDPVLRAAVAELAVGRLPSAINAIQGYLAINPGDPVAMRLLGQIAFNLGNSRDAEQMFRSVLELVPGYRPVRFELASSLLMQGQTATVLAEADALLQRDPQNRDFLNLKATALGKLGKVDAAILIYEKLLTGDAQSTKLWIDYGNALRTKRRSDEAISAFRRATVIKAHCGEAWWNIANMKTGQLSPRDIEEIREALRSSQASQTDRFHLHFAIARGLEEQGDFQHAFTAYTEANQARLAIGGTLKGPSTTERVERSLNLFTREFMTAHAGIGHPASDPIFIVGMPRSGSTLVEQILSSHPMIEGTQELSDLLLIARDLDGEDFEYPCSITNLSNDAIRALGNRYIETTRGQRRTGRSFFIDKQPANWLHIGLILLILPNAKIINVRRDPLANCLSMFRQHFGRGIMYSYSIETLTAEYVAYDRLSKHFDGLFPDRIKNVKLENIVNDLEGSVRDMLNHLDLPFSSHCLSYFESERAVFTPSSEQVRRPINDDASAILTGFQPYIADIKEALNRVL